MTPEYVVKLGQDTLLLTLLIGGPALIVALVVGLAVSIFQAVTQIHEMTLTFIPKILAIFGSLLLFMPFMLATLSGFTERLMARIAGAG